jgi:hypothetical protein
MTELAGTVGEVIVSGEYAAKTGFKATTLSATTCE